jgi:tRNA dimethylallyltransferase
MKVLTRGICEGPQGSAKIREQLLEEEREKGLKALHDELKAIDPTLGAKLHPNDRQRIMRAVEVFRSTGRPLSQWQEEHRFEQTLYPSIKVFLHREREVIYERINRRVMVMIEQGFKEEVEQLLQMGYGPELKPMQSLGYKQMVQHLLGKCSLDEAVYSIQKETRHYAKRQMTWFRADPEFQWMDAGQRDGIVEWVEKRIGE